MFNYFLIFSTDGEHHKEIEAVDDKPDFSFLSGQLLSSSITDNGTANNEGQSVISKTNTELALPYSGGTLYMYYIIHNCIPILSLLTCLLR